MLIAFKSCGLVSLLGDYRPCAVKTICTGSFYCSGIKKIAKPESKPEKHKTKTGNKHIELKWRISVKEHKYSEKIGA